MHNRPLSSLVIVSTLQLVDLLCTTWMNIEDSGNCCCCCFFGDSRSSHCTWGTRKWDIEVGLKLSTCTIGNKQLRN